MKIIRLLIATALVSASALASAQSGNKLMSVNIPFEFQAAGKVLPAGHYVLTAINNYGIIDLRQVDGKHGMLLVTHDETAPRAAAQSKLIFSQTADGFRLMQIDQRGQNTCYNLPLGKSLRSERAAAGQIATLVADNQ